MKRYELYCDEMNEAPDGEYVLYSDAEARIAALEAACRGLLTDDVPNCGQCKAITVKAGDSYRCLNCGWERNWWAAKTEPIRAALSRTEDGGSHA